MQLRKISVIILLLMFSWTSHSQSNVQLKLNVANGFMPLTDTDYPWKPFKPFNYQPGIQLSYEFFIYDRKLSNRISGMYVLNYPVSSMFISTSLHWAIYNKWKSAVNIFAGIGTGFSFNEIGNSGSTPFPVIGIEYNRSVTEKLDVNATLSQPYPYSLNAQLGLRYWFSKKIKQKAGCLSCPS